MPSRLPGLNAPRATGRRTHVIRGNDRVFAPSNRAFVDTEALRTALDERRERQTLAFGWLCTERVQNARTRPTMTEKWTRFTTADECFTALAAACQSHSTLYVYAHNWSYDAAMLSLATMAPKYDWEILEYVNASHLLWVTLKHGDRKMVFVDTLNYFAMSLEKLGEAIGALKLKMPKGKPTGEAWDAYCRNDVEVLRTAMHSYFDLIVGEDLGGYRKTLASQAYGAWRHRFMRHKVLVLADASVEALERSAYHGGRSEVFYDLPIFDTVYCLDVNSMYPAMMRDHVYPAWILERGYGGGVDALRALLEEGCVVATVALDTDEPCYPYSNGDRVIYPVGRFITTLTTPELRYAFEHGHLLSVGQWVLYAARPLFTEYVDTLYRLRINYRQAGNEAFAFMLKIMLNSLYGKFGQRGYKWLPCDAASVDGVTEWRGNCDPEGPSLLHRERFGQLWHRVEDGEAFESFPAIAAHVTAQARMYLWTLRKQAGVEHVYYTDTDSLYVDACGFAALKEHIDPSQLGKLKCEGVFGGAHFRAPKDYHLLDKERVKGKRAKAHWLDSNSWVHDQFESYDSVLGRGADGEIIVTKLTKHAYRVNHQSVGNGVGWRTPIVLGREE